MLLEELRNLGILHQLLELFQRHLTVRCLDALAILNVLLKIPSFLTFLVALRLVLVFVGAVGLSLVSLFGPCQLAFFFVQTALQVGVASSRTHHGPHVFVVHHFQVFGCDFHAEVLV